MQYVSLMILGYFCGSVPFGKLIAAARGVDIQKRGSGNIGFANVQRVLGWRAGLLTLAGDILKGLLPTLAALRLTSAGFAFWVGVAAIVGHVFPLWLRFRGGKGVATGLGLVIVLQPVAAAAGAIIYVFGRAILRSSALGSLAGIAGVLVVGCLIVPGDWWHYALLLAIALWTLRHNILGTLPAYDT